MTLQYQTEIDTALNEAQRRFVFSGYQWVSSRKADLLSLAGGIKSYWDLDSSVVDTTTLFDLGSLTKVVLATSVFARLWERNEIGLEETLSETLPAFKHTGYANIQLGQLLNHTSGLIAWYPFYQEPKQDLIEIFLRRESEFLLSHSGSKTHPTALYSDLGFLLLGEVLKARWGRLQTLFAREVVAPLGLNGVRFGPISVKETAATEYCFERKGVVHGEVFDLNTVWLNGISAHAGLFSSAAELLPWATEWLKALQGKSSWLKPETAAKFSSRSGAVSGSSWGFGWDTKSAAFSSAGKLFSMQSFGHLGFPGTSVWIDPENEGIAILLTNRVHPSRYDERIKKFRPLIHDLVAKSWGIKK